MVVATLTRRVISVAKVSQRVMRHFCIAVGVIRDIFKKLQGLA